MCTHDCIYLDVYTWMRTHVCIDLDVYTWVYWRGYVHMYVLTLLCCVMYASTRAVHRWILQCHISKRIAICIAIFSLISPLTWFTLVSFFCAEKLWWKRYTWCWICQTRHIALLLCWRFENYVLVFEMVTEMCQLFYITCLILSLNQNSES